MLNIAYVSARDEAKASRSKEDIRYYDELSTSIDTLIKRLSSSAQYEARRNPKSLVDSWWAR